MTLNATVFSQGLFVTVFFFLYYNMTDNVHVFNIDSANKQLCLLGLDRVVFLPEQRFVGLHTLMCHAEREKTLSRASVMPCGCGTCSITLENIRNRFFNMYECYIYWPKSLYCSVLLNA